MIKDCSNCKNFCTLALDIETDANACQFYEYEEPQPMPEHDNALEI